MFHKPFSVKSDRSLRSSEKKKLLATIPRMDGITNKTMVSLIQMTSHKGNNVTVYTFDKEPLFFTVDREEILYPTIYCTWKIPDVFPVLVTNENVFEKLFRGADLFLQGVVRPLRETSDFGKNTPVAVSVRTSTNKLRGPLAVGCSLMSSTEMIANGMQGPGVRLLHFYGDLLWDMGTRIQPSEVPFEAHFSALSINDANEFPPLSLLMNGNKNSLYVCQHAKEADGPLSSLDTELKQESDEAAVLKGSQNADTMEDLLKRCFLAALKYRVTTKGQLPLDIGEFYSHYLLPCVPSGQRIDIKKTVYKKFSAFLEDINKDENGHIVKIATKHKGSGMITEVNWGHPLLASFRITDEVDDTKNPIKMVKVDEFLAVTESVSAIFKPHCQKGDLLSKAQARDIIIAFVKDRNLILNEKVTPTDSLLVSVLNSDEPVNWNTLVQKITSKMTKTYVVTWTDGRQLVRKMELPKIVFKVENRAGNKKVTLINNLSIYGIDCKRIYQEIQTGAAASATIISSAIQCEGPQILVQGNQVSFISNLIATKYGIDKKYMSGLELIPKKR